MLYIARSTTPGAPKPDYMEGVLAAAVEADLPEAYRRELETYVPTALASAAPAQAPKVRPLWSAPTAVRRPQRG
jgi:hypothetical protein